MIVHLCTTREVSVMVTGDRETAGHSRMMWNQEMAFCLFLKVEETKNGKNGCNLWTTRKTLMEFTVWGRQGRTLAEHRHVSVWNGEEQTLCPATGMRAFSQTEMKQVDFRRLSIHAQ